MKALLFFFAFAAIAKAARGQGAAGVVAPEDLARMEEESAPEGTNRPRR